MNWTLVVSRRPCVPHFDHTVSKRCPKTSQVERRRVIGFIWEQWSGVILTYNCETNSSRCSDWSVCLCWFVLTTGILTCVCLDGKTGLVSGLVSGFQGWKWPGTQTQTWHQSQMTQIYSNPLNFLTSPRREHRSHGVYFPVFYQDFFLNVKFYSKKTSFPGGESGIWGFLKLRFLLFILQLDLKRREPRVKKI